MCNFAHDRKTLIIKCKKIKERELLRERGEKKK
jgi:hypothetical protein